MRSFLHANSPMLLLLAIIMVIVAWAAAASSPSPRNVNQLSQWANQQGVVMHDSLQWKKAAAAEDADENDNDDNIGLELKGSVQPGTVLLKVPRSIVFDAQCIRKELEDENNNNPDNNGTGTGAVQKALEKLAQSGFDQHRDGFFIFCKVLRCCQEGEKSLWYPYIQSLPRHFIEFSNTEKSCLPFYAKYVADYQEDKFKAFCDAAVESGLIESVVSDDDDDDFNQARWAFCAISSRFWKTSSTEAGTAEIMKGNAAPAGATADANDNVVAVAATSELVPVGDMFNHREPPNVAITHEGDFVNFVYKGDDGDDDDTTAAAAGTKDLYITYGQPSNPHRFLGIFGFVPVNDMPNVWSHVIYTDNPFTDDVENMVFRAEDGHVPKKVWDAVLYALLEPKHPPNEPPEFTDEQHTKYRTYTADVLQGHIAKQLQELSALREKIKMIEAIGSSSGNTNNIPLIRQHNEFLTDVFTKVQKQVQDELVNE